MQIRQKFYEKVQTSEHCYLWLGVKQPNGYGVFRPARNIIGSDLVHRFAWFLVNGVIPEKMQVLHKCDNRACCNPKHLFLGTQVDNMLDKIKKGRAKTGVTTGEKHWKCKLSDIEVAQIIADPRGPSAIARTYNINRGYVWKLKQGQARKLKKTNG